MSPGYEFEQVGEALVEEAKEAKEAAAAAERRWGWTDHIQQTLCVFFVQRSRST
jgi:hypothetical protein